MNHENSHRWQTDDRHISLCRTRLGLLSKQMGAIIFDVVYTQIFNQLSMNKEEDLIRLARGKTLSVQLGSVNIVLYSWSFILDPVTDWA